jgi:ParB family transcriptional regulator, chromosome partitioning protein
VRDAHFCCFSLRSKTKMAQNYGLGRGLASLIPQKRKSTGLDEAQRADEAGKTIDKPDEKFNYFGVSLAPRDASLAPNVAMPATNAGTTLSRAETDKTKSEKNIQEVEVFRIVPNPHQPRLSFNEEKLQELAGSIKEHGIIQPIIVSKNNGNYEIIAGERRFLAAKLAGLKTVPAIVRDASEQQKLELAITENIQRHDLDPIEEAKALKKLMEEFDMSQEEVAQKIGKSRSAVANKVRLLNLPVEIQKSLIVGKITEGHCKLLLAIPNPEKQRAFYEMILKNNLTVRQTEDKTKEISVRMHKRTLHVDPAVKQIEDELSQKLGTKVKLTKSGGGGRITIEYYSQEELNGILDKISK